MGSERGRWIEQGRAGPDGIRSRLAGAFALLLVLVAGLVAASALVARDLHQGVERRLVEDALPLRRAVYDLQSRLLDEQSGVRGFVITAREGSLTPYRQAAAAVRSDLERIRGLAPRHAELEQLVLRIEPQIAAVEAYFAEEIALVRSGLAGQIEAQQRIEQGRVLFDRFRTTSDELIARSNAIVESAVAAQNRRYRDLLAVLGLAGGAAVLLVAALGWRVPRRTVALMRAERRARERSERLEATVAGLAAAGTPVDVASVIVTQARAALAAGSALVYLLDPGAGELRLVAEAGYDAGALDAYRTQPLDADSRLGLAVRGLAPVILESRGETLDRFPHFASLDEAAIGHASITVPLVAGGEAIGGFFLGFAADRRFDPEDVALFETLGRQCSQALERALLLESEHASRDRAERLDELSAALSSAVTPTEIARICLEVGGGALGAVRGWFGRVDSTGRVLEQAGQRGYDARLEARWAEVDIAGPSPAAEAMRTRRPVFASSPAELLARYPDLGPLLERTGDQAWAVLPLPSAGRALGVLLLAFDRPVHLDAGRRRFALEVAERCARALERGREYELQRHAAETLQRGALPELLPAIDGLDLGATYLAGSEVLEVGGDWYDAFAVPGRGEVALVVGDVVGKGVEAASTMARLRNALRAYALEGLPPERVLARLNELWTREPPTYATVLLGSLDLASLRLRLAAAGHPPPLLVPAEGPGRFLHEPRGTPLGAVFGGEPVAAELQLAPGDALLLYSDGLVESRDLPLDAGLERLRLLAEGGRDLQVDDLIEHVTAGCLAGRRQMDDVVVLVVRVGRFTGADPAV